MPLKLSPRNKIIAIVAIAAVIMIVFLLLVFRPKITELSQVRAEQGAEQAKLEKNKAKLKRLDAIRLEAAEIEAQRIALAQRMPGDAQLPSLIIDIQKLANEADLDMQAIQFSDPSEQQGYQEVSFELQAESSFYTVIDFLYRLEKMKREVVVDALSMKTGTYPLLKTSIKARTFILSNIPIEKSPVPGAPAAAAQPTAGSSAAPATQ